MSLFHRHEWLKWSKLVEGYSGNKLQFRMCNLCGRVQKRSIGTCDQVNVAASNEAINATKIGDSK